MLYDIIHVEDNSDDRKCIMSELEGLTYLGMPSLQGLLAILNEHSAKVYVVDGRFPDIEGCQIKDNASNAIEAIRKKQADAKIILFSGSDFGNVSQKYNVEFKEKGVYYAREFADYLKSILRPA